MILCLFAVFRGPIGADEGLQRAEMAHQLLNRLAVLGVILLGKFANAQELLELVGPVFEFASRPALQ